VGSYNRAATVGCPSRTTRLLLGRALAALSLWRSVSPASTTSGFAVFSEPDRFPDFNPNLLHRLDLIKKPFLPEISFEFSIRLC